MKPGEDEIGKRRAAYFRASRAAIAADDAGRPSAKLDAIAERARARLEGAKRGEPAKRSAARLEIEIAKGLASAWNARGTSELKLQKEGNRWYVSRWTPGEMPELLGPFKSELAACKKLTELAT